MNYQLLTNIEFVDGNSNLEKKLLLFYERCLAGRLAENDIRFRHDGTARFKLEALPKVVNFIFRGVQSSREKFFSPTHRPAVCKADIFLSTGVA
ncbi:MAG: hypothetical protein IJU50_11555 [Lachnospiraceae bacterium]|nr:hypothetical protein [Lachnospiraceae bacterium]